MHWQNDSSSAVTASANKNSGEQSISSTVLATATEVNPSLYDELKLGHKGAGFKRLV